jgi:predicted CopG family antitoxin
MDTDERRKLVLKRKIDLLQQDSDLFSKVLETLRDGKRERISDLLTLVRSDASLSEIRILVAEELTERSLSGDCSVFEESHSQAEEKEMPTAKTRHKALDIEWLSDIPVLQVPTHPWTNITNDEDFVSHLVSLWFTWHYPSCSTWIEKQLFLRDMQAEACVCSEPFCLQALLKPVYG